MSWYVITKQRNGLEARSSSLSSEKGALLFARELIASGVAVERIEGDGEDIAGGDVAHRLAELQSEH